MSGIQKQVMMNCGTVFPLGGSSEGVTCTAKNVIFNMLIYFLFYIIHGSSYSQAIADLHLHFLLFD